MGNSKWRSVKKRQKHSAKLKKNTSQPPEVIPVSAISEESEVEISASDVEIGEESEVEIPVSDVESE